MSFNSWVRGFSVVSGFTLLLACSAGDPAPGGNNGGSGNTSSGTGGSGGGDPNPAGGNGGSGPTFIVDSGIQSDAGLRPKVCDETGRCTCVNLAALGLDKGEANENDTTAFQTWLNTKSTANVTMIPQRSTLTEEFLSNYDVIILQVQAPSTSGPFWQFSPGEVAAVQKWVEEDGGGLITLTGYGANPAEVDPVNQLLAFSGMSYNKDDILGQCQDNLCYCWRDSVPLTGWNSSHPVAADITQVGAFHGRSINAGDADVVAGGGNLVYAAAKQIGKGKVFVFADEWVIYSNQWLAGEDHSNRQPEYDPCYDTQAGHWRDAANVFQVPQFWYNVITWASPPSECTFTIEDPRIVK
jgi:hypothetical protein